MSREQSWRTFSASVRSSIASDTKSGQFMESGVDKLERSVDNPEIQMEGRDVRDETQSNQWPLWIGAIALCLSVSSCKPDDSPFKAENESIRKQLAKQESVVTSLQDGNKVMQQQIDLLNQELRDAKKSAESAKADARAAADNLAIQAAQAKKLSAEDQLWNCAVQLAVWSSARQPVVCPGWISPANSYPHWSPRLPMGRTAV